jgi:glycerol-3-phosphate O-acyltransferase
MSSFMGANLDYFPMGAIARRVGMMHVRRAIKRRPRLQASRSGPTSATSWVDRVNLMWSIEGGRTRTGKLRPPRLGLLRYVVDAVDTLPTPEVYIVPISMLYDQIPPNEVRTMTHEALGGRQAPRERAMVRPTTSPICTGRMGRVYLNVGEPLPLRAATGRVAGGGPDRPHRRRAGRRSTSRTGSTTPPR